MKAKDLNILQQLAVNGDKSAENELFDSLSGIFIHFVQQRVRDINDCEEIVQDTIMIITAKYKDIEFKISFTAWAYNILKKNLLKHYRTKGLHDNKMEDYKRGNIEINTSEIPTELNLKLNDCLKKINSINNRYARILNLKHKGYTTEEICEKMNLTRNNVYSILTRARTRLKLCLETGEVEL